jgi:hypothetical protein
LQDEAFFLETFYLDFHVCDLEASVRSVYPGYKNSFRNPVKFLYENYPPRNETFSNCFSKGEIENCNSFVVRILTDFGICFAANMLDIQEILEMPVISDDLKSIIENPEENSKTG